MREIPISAAKRIAAEYGYDQVIIYARVCHDSPEPHGEHMTTYGRNKEHCGAAAKIGNYLKRCMHWDEADIIEPKRGADCDVCGGKRLHYANCPQAKPDEEVYTFNSFRVELAKST